MMLLPLCTAALCLGFIVLLTGGLTAFLLVPAGALCRIVILLTKTLSMLPFSHIRIAQTAVSFDHWIEFQQKLLTDILHLLALSGCTAEEIQRENLQLSADWRIGEDVCQIAYNQQQTAQHNNQMPYNLAV